MKHRFAAAALALAATFFCATVFAETPGPGGRLLHIEGTVETRAPGETAWKTSQKGTFLAKGTAIKTAPASACDIGLGEKHRSVVRMKENSQVVLDTLDPAKIQVKLDMGQLLVWARDLPKESTFQVKSPTAIASARGTGWEQDLETIQVFEQSVEVSDRLGESMLLEEGSGVDFTPEGLGEVFEVTQEAKEAFDGFQEEAEKLSEETTPEEKPADTEEKSEEKSGEEAPEEVAQEPEGDLFEAFNEGFESPEQEAADEGSEAMIEAQEESEESEPPDDLQDDDDEKDCNVYPYC